MHQIHVNRFPSAPDEQNIPVHTDEMPHPAAQVGAVITDFALRPDVPRELPLTQVDGLAKPNRTLTTDRRDAKVKAAPPSQRSALR